MDTFRDNAAGVACAAVARAREARRYVNFASSRPHPLSKYGTRSQNRRHIIAVFGDGSQRVLGVTYDRAVHA